MDNSSTCLEETYFCSQLLRAADIFDTWGHGSGEEKVTIED